MAIDVYCNLAHLSRDELIIYLAEEAYLAPFLAPHAPRASGLSGTLNCEIIVVGLYDFVIFS